VARLHEDAFGEAGGRDWWRLVSIHSFGWVTARLSSDLVGFVNVVWDGRDHAWLQDVMVDSTWRRTGIGKAMVGLCRDEVGRAGCEWLHVDFEEKLQPFYLACGFARSQAGLMHLGPGRA
jgi:GNAT superfamily N-acetyltransferase